VRLDARETTRRQCSSNAILEYTYSPLSGCSQSGG
jgi:hypothetical protein